MIIAARLLKMAYVSDHVIASVVIESIFMHDPVGLLAMGSTAFVEHKGLPHADPPAVAAYHLITASGLPESSRSCTIGTCSCRVLLVLMAKEVPIILWCGSYFTLLCKNQYET